MKKYWIVLLVVLSYFTLLGQESSLIIEKSNGPNPWSDLHLNNHSDQFQFLIVTDRTGGHRPGIFEDAIHKINLLQPEFVLSVGDLIEGYTEDTSILNAEWAEFNGFIDQLKMPFFYVPGNHDITNKVMEDEYIKRFGRTYYHFVYKDVLFLCLNSEDQLRGAGRGTISEPQYKYIKQTLSEHNDVRYTFVFLHQPLWIQGDPKMWPQVEEILEDRDHTVFAGHYHRYEKRDRNNGKYVMLATTGGGSRLRGSDFGEFDHVAWVTMTEAGPVMANLWLQGIWDENVTTKETRGLIEKLLASQLVEIDPYFTDQFTEEQSFKMKLTNHLDVPLSIQIDERFGWDVWITMDKDTIDLAPNSVEWITGTFYPRNNATTIDHLRATPTKLNVSLKLSEETMLNIPVTVNLKPLKPNYISKLDGPLKIDGQIEDGIKLGHTFQSGNNTMHFDVIDNGSHLVVMAEVEDDEIIIDTSTYVSRQDNIGLFVTLLPKVKSARAPNNRYYLRTTVETDQYESQVSGAKGIPGDWKYICKRTDSGYVFELAIPMETIDKMQGGAWKSIRINWTMDDLDNPDDWHDIQRKAYLPGWGTSDEIVGSGIFLRNR